MRRETRGNKMEKFPRGPGGRISLTGGTRKILETQRWLPLHEGELSTERGKKAALGRGWPPGYGLGVGAAFGGGLRQGGPGLLGWAAGKYAMAGGGG